MQYEVEEGVYTARFQPLSIGHWAVIKEILKRCKRLYVGLAYPDPIESYDKHPVNIESSKPKNNPFTYFERYLMFLNGALKDEEVGPDRLVIVPYESLSLYPDWPDSSYFPKDAVWFFNVTDDNEWERSKIRRAEERGRKVYVLDKPELKNRMIVSGEKISGEKIRRLIYEDDEIWKEMVPSGVQEVIERPGVIDRLKFLYHEDEKNTGEETQQQR